MSGPASHFVVDMWTSNVINKVLEGASDSDKPKSSKKGYTAPLIETQSSQAEGDISHVGPSLWSSEWPGYYQEPSKQQNASDATAPAATKRRANNFTISGRPAAAILYQELSKVNVDAHRLVEPYDYGEQLGPAENLSQPFRIDVHPQVGFLTDIHGHLCDAEVIGLLAGKWDAPNKRLYIQAPFPCAATERHEDFGFTDVELDPEAEWKVRQSIAALGLEVVGWYHSHPKFKPNPSVMDIFNQQQYQLYTRDETTGEEPFVGLIVSTYDSQLSTPASDHQWFTVVPYAPPVRRNSVIEEDAADEKPRKEESQDLIHMPVRMAVTYHTVNLAAALTAEVCSIGVCDGFVNSDSAKTYAEPLLKSLMALRLQDTTSAAPTSKNTSTNSSSKQTSTNSGAKEEGSAAEIDTTGAAVAPAKRKYTPRKPKVPVEDVQEGSVASEVARKTLSAQALAVHNKPLTGSASQPTSSKSAPPMATTGLNKAAKGGSKGANSLKSSTSLEDGEVHESSDGGGGGPSADNASEKASDKASSSALNSLQMDSPPTVSDEDMLETLQAQIRRYDKSEEDNSYWRTLPTPPEITPSNSTGAIAGILGMHIEGTTSEQVADGELARRLGAEEEAQGTGGRARRATRDTKKNERFGDFVDTLEATKHLRKQNMDAVKATELKQKQKAAADRAKLKAPVLTVVPVIKAEPDTSNKKQKVTEGKKVKNEPCDDCAPGFSLTDSTLCGTIVPKKKAPSSTPGKPEKEVDSVHTSIILALQDLERPSAALAREMLCSVVPVYRGLVLLVVSMGFYYARSPRRVDLSKNWKGLARIEKIKASAAVWIQRLGLSADPSTGGGAAQVVVAVRGAASNADSSDSAASSSDTGVDTSSTDDYFSDAKQGDTANNSTGLTSSRNSSSAKLAPENATYRLNEWVGKFLTACWEDYSKTQNRKRKA